MIQPEDDDEEEGKLKAVEKHMALYQFTFSVNNHDGEWGVAESGGGGWGQGRAKLMIEANMLVRENALARVVEES